MRAFLPAEWTRHSAEYAQSGPAREAEYRLRSPARDRQECLSHRGSSPFQENWPQPQYRPFILEPSQFILSSEWLIAERLAADDGLEHGAALDVDENCDAVGIFRGLGYAGFKRDR